MWPPGGCVENALWGKGRGTHQKVMAVTGPEMSRLELGVGCRW